MNSQEMNNQTRLYELVTKYETLSREGRLASFDIDTYNQLIEYFEKELLYERALEVVNEAGNRYPESIGFILKKVHLLISSKSYEEANNLLNQADTIMPESLDVALHRIWILSEQDMVHEALEILDELKYRNYSKEELSRIYYYEAQVFERMEHPEQMFYTLKEAIRHDYDNEDALEKMWLCVERTHKYEESAEFHETVVSEKPYSHWGWFNLANAYEYLCQYEKAIEAYEFAIVIKENFEFAYRNCAEICFHQGQFKKALYYYREINDRFEQDDETLLRIAVCNLKAGETSEAKKYLSIAEEEDAFNDEVYFYYGECFASEGNWKKAIFYYRQAISLEPCRDDYFLGIARAFCELGQPEKAERFFRKAAFTGAETMSNWHEYINFLRRTGNLERAFEIVEMAELNTGDPSIRYARIACLFTAGRKAEALYYLGEALEEDSTSHELLFEWMGELRQDARVAKVVASFHQHQDLLPVSKKF